jgi:hypothetical protein
VIYAAHGGPTALSNHVALCGLHHRLVHDGGYRLKLAPGGQLVVLDPDGQRVPHVPVPARGSTDELVLANAGRGRDPATTRRGAGCEPFDLDLTIDVLLGLAARGAAERA